MQSNKNMLKIDKNLHINKISKFLNLQIMVKTRGLGHALGKAVITRSKRFMEAEDEENVVDKEKKGEKKGVEVKKNNVKSKENQEKGRK